ncbi:hypothetical protein E1285_00145 [Actinomadura sp. 7K507]|nr:hypothetical protein E1285_00145 [Actinomadura sp. 7K507]
MRIGRGRRPRGICLDDAASASRSETMRVLSAWCEMIIAERGATRLSGPDVTTLTSFLQANLDWLISHAVAADFAADIAALVANAGRALNPVRVRTIDLGQCTIAGCGGTVRATTSIDGQGSVPRIRCDAGHTWAPRQWLDLRRQLESPDSGLITRRSTP